MSQLSLVSLTSDKDYLKIFDDGEITINANAAPAADETFPSDAYATTLTGSKIITHNLGTPPLVRGFWDPLKSGVWWAAHAFPNSVEIDPFLNMIVDGSTLKLIMATNGAAQTDIPVFYRIYDLGNVAVTSDSRIDKIFAKSQGSGSVAAAASSFSPKFTIVTIPHNQGEVPLWTLQFSEDNQNWYGENGKIIGAPDTTTGPPGGPYSVYFYTRAFGSADKNNFYIYLESNYLSTKTIYYRYSLDYRK